MDKGNALRKEVENKAKESRPKNLQITQKKLFVSVSWKLEGGGFGG